MKAYFTQEQIKQQQNKIYIEDDELLLEAEFLEGEGKHYVVTGVAVIEGERYHDFEIEFELTEFPKEETAVNIINMDWEWYDYLI